MKPHGKDMRAPKAQMQHRHYATIAAIIRDIPNTDDLRAGIAQHFARRLTGTNPGFNKERFIAACMAEEGEGS
jgi:hypothetical protein